MPHLVPAEKTLILGVKIDRLPLEALLDEITAAVESRVQTTVAHANITGLNLAYEQPWLRDFYNRADRVYCDGMGVRLGAWLLSRPRPPRYTLADWIWPLAERAAQAGFSLFLLGNPPGVPERAAARLIERVPQVKIAGAYHGYFDRTPGAGPNRAIVDSINAAAPDVLLVGFGMPAQERWLLENRECLCASVAITCGALFEYLSADLRRGPPWMTQNYLEWLARVYISPRRYARRYLRDIPLFLRRVLEERRHSC